MSLSNKIEGIESVGFMADGFFKVDFLLPLFFSISRSLEAAMSPGKQRFQIIRNRDWRQLAGEPWFFRWMVVPYMIDGV